MRADEVLNRYAAGERNFRRADLRGQSFKGEDLSDADFSETDIRGANFTNAVLKRANFTRAKAGLQKRWLWVQLGLALLVFALTGFSSAFLWELIVSLFFNTTSERTVLFIVGIFYLVLVAATFIAIARQGFTAKAFGSIAVAGGVAVAVTVGVAVAVAGAVGVAVGGAVGGAGGVAGAVAVAVTGAGGVGVAVAVTVAGGVAGAVANLLLAIYCSRRALKGDEKFALLRTFGIAFGALGGTSFCGADLTHANFKHAILKGTNFNFTKQRQTVLEWVCWQDAQQLDRARVGTSILANPAVRDLLVTRDGYKKNYIDAALRATDLDGVNLEQASLTWADLTCATLRYANLKNANLTESLVLNTNFTGATLTGACLQAWNIDSQTNLEQVNCQYVYLLRNRQERRPSSGDFAPGEFTKLFQEVLSTVDLIFRNGIDWKAFVYSFNKLVLNNEGTELSIQSIENKGDGVVVVRVNAPPDADKAKLHSEFNQTYEAAVKSLEAEYRAKLQAKDDQIMMIHRQHSADMFEVTRLLAKQPVPVTILNENKLMNDSNDQSRTINVGGDFNASGSTVNLGTISGSVTNTINQLPDEPDPTQPNLKQLLSQLQQAIETDPELPDTDKADLLEQVQNLAAAKQTEEPAQKEGLVRKAKKMFEVTLKSLPDTAKIVEACSKLLPLILNVLGFPV